MMVAANLSVAANFTFTAEGDDTVTRDADDPGCWSGAQCGVGHLVGCKYGVSAAELASWMGLPSVTADQMAALQLSTGQAIFGARYWQAESGDLLPSGVDLSVVDHAFNAGDSKSAKILQRLIGMPLNQVDGWCGAQTCAAVAAFDCMPLLSRLSVQSAKVLQKYLGVLADGNVGPITKAAATAQKDKTFILCAALADAQLSDYRGDAGWAKYGAGWTNRVWARLTAALKLLEPKT